jgi:hypothetical protein
LPDISISVERQTPDARSGEIQCKFKFRNDGNMEVRVLSVRVLNATGTKVQEVLDSGLTKDRDQLDRIYLDFTRIIRPVVLKKFPEFRQSYEGPSPSTNDAVATNTSEEFRAAREAWRLDVNNSIDAEQYFKRFIEPDPGSEMLRELYQAKISTARRLEARLGLDRSLLKSNNSASLPLDTKPRGQGLAASRKARPQSAGLTAATRTQQRGNNNSDEPDEYLTDVGPGEEFTRDYIIKCPRRPFMMTSYIQHFDCRYVVQTENGWSEPQNQKP